MNEEIRTHLAALNTTWQRSAQAEEEQLDPAIAEALHGEQVKAWEGLDACGLAEWMLGYDPATLTCSLPRTSEMAEDDCAQVTRSRPTERPAADQGSDVDPDSGRVRLVWRGPVQDCVFAQAQTLEHILANRSGWVEGEEGSCPLLANRCVSVTRGW